MANKYGKNASNRSIDADADNLKHRDIGINIKVRIRLEKNHAITRKTHCRPENASLGLEKPIMNIGKIEARRLQSNNRCNKVKEIAEWIWMDQT